MSRTIHFEGLKPGQSYYFQVVAKSSDGSVKSARSNVITFTALGDTVAPDMPTSLQTNFSTSTFTASWSGPDVSNTPDFRDYKITISKPAGVSYQEFYTVNKSFVFSFQQNISFFGATTPSPSVTISVAARDTSGNISSSTASTGVNAAPDDYPVLSASPIAGGFSASWSSPAASFTDYAYSEMYLSGLKIWQGTNTYAEYSNFALYNTVSVTVRHFDIFNQAGPSSSVATVTPTPPIVLDTNAPSNATGLTVTASNSGGANGMSGYIVARWNESTDTTLRGARIRVRAQGDQSYQYENLAGTASGTGSYQIGNLIPGFVYEVAISSYDEINNTSSFTLSSPSAILVPFGIPQSESVSASANVSSSIVALGTTVSASMVGQIIAGYGLQSGTIITGSFTGSVSVSPNTASAFSGSSVSLYKGMTNWRSYVTAGASMRFGTGVNGTQHGIWLDNNNYWYTTGNIRVGSNTSFIGWDGQTASITGNITAKSGSFDGNIFITSGGTLVAASSLTGARVLLNQNGIIAYNSAGTNTFVLNAANGNIGASAGTIGGWTLDSASLYAGTGASTVGLALPSSSTDIAIWAGSANKQGAPFRVAANGNASMTNAFLSGSISSTSGSIGSWLIGATSLSAGTGATEVAMSTGAVSFWAGGTSAAAPFRVSNTGSLVATAGSIGGWLISASQLSAGTGATEVAISTGATSFWAGSTSTAAPFRVTNAGALTATSGQIGGFSISASTLLINTGTGGNTVLVAMRATASTSNAGNYPFQIETNTVSGTSSLSTYIRTQLAYSACVTTLNAVPQKISWLKLGTASPGWARENILQLFSIIPTKYVAEDGSTVTFDPLYDGYTGMVWRNGNTTGGSFTYLVNSPTGDTYLDSNQGNLYLRPKNSIIASNSISMTGTSSSFVITNGTFRVDWSSDGSSPFTIGNGSSSTAFVQSPAVYARQNVNPANMQIGNTGIFSRSTSTFKIKNNISSLNNYSKISNVVPIEKINNVQRIDPFKVLSITPVTFNSLLAEDSKEVIHLGFIAEDIANKFPELATYNENREAEYYNVNGIVAALLAVAQSYQEKINDLESRVLSLENK